MTHCNRQVCRYCSTQGFGFEIESSKTMLDKLLERIEYQIKRGSHFKPTSGRKLFNRLIGIVEDSNKLIVIGGRPSSLHFAVAEAILFDLLDADKLSAIVGTEVGNQSILRRYLAKLSELQASKIAFGALSDCEWLKVEKTVAQIVNKNNFFAISCSSMTIDSLVLEIRKLKVQKPELGLVLISVDDFIDSFESACCSANIMCLGGALKHLVGDLNISIVVTVGLSDEIDSRPNHQAYLHDFPGYLNLSHYSDVLALCERPDLYEEDTAKHTNLMKLYVCNKWDINSITIPISETMMLEIENCQHLT